MLRFGVIVISYWDIQEACREHSDWKSGLERWYQIATSATWTNPYDVTQTLNYTDPVGRCVVFNIQHNRCRVICKIDYEDQTVVIMDILSHPEYTKDGWKNDCGCI
jgi:mRNA-degrading endonuclease HigB of HigAB toxin-antitoxin module